MQRISTNMPNDDMQYHLRIREWKMNDLQNKIAEQTRIGNLRDGPESAAHSTRYQSYLTRMDRYMKNIDTIQSDFRITEDYLRGANELVHRIREIAVQGANGTYSVEQTQMMGVEVNQLLNELVEIANARSAEGTSLFGGDKNDSQSFRILQGNVPNAQGQVITQVMYTGGRANNMSEISDGNVISTGFAGNELFWAEQHEIFSDGNATDYLVQRDTEIFIDGEAIRLRSGDNVYAIIAKINDSNAAVRAGLDPVNNSLVINTTYPHQLWMEDSETGTVLRDLGIVSEFGKPPYNAATEARVAGGSLFDMVIYLRDKLYSGDTIDIGGSALKGIDLAQNTLLSSIADLGARYERLDTVHNRLSFEVPDIIQRNSNEVDLDLSEAIVNLKMYEYTHKAALQTAGRILQPTLLDFLR